MTTAIARIPGQAGLPYLGESRTLFGNPIRYAERHHAQYGAVVRTTFLGRPGVVLLSAEAQKYVMVDHATNFSWHAGYALGEDLFGDALFVIDDPDHAFQRKLMTPAFTARALAAYQPDMDAVTRDYVAPWSAQEAVDLYPFARAVTFRLSATLLAGLQPDFDQATFQRLFTRLLAGASEFVRRDIPGTKYSQALHARRELVPLLKRLIAQRREHPTQDALGLLVAARDETGQGLSEEHLVGLAITLIFAGFESTAGTLTWLLTELVQSPAWYARARAICTGDPDAPVTDGDVKQPVLDAMIDETLRLHPATPLIMRGAVADFPWQGYTISAGTQIFLIPGYTQRRPDYFADPNLFNPQRFLDGEEKAHPAAYVGFGGGSRSCIGSGIARREIKTVLQCILRRYDLTLVPGQNLAPRRFPLNRPTANVRVRLTPRQGE
ncbi:MAG: cytochrome P450 [Ktedonobacterales bacterium]|nr:cytochrome P450 [Ktedonobacterales bacterium]